jgi:hypothetical protein
VELLGAGGVATGLAERMARSRISSGVSDAAEGPVPRRRADGAVTRDGSRNALVREVGGAAGGVEEPLRVRRAARVEPTPDSRAVRRLC